MCVFTHLGMMLSKAHELGYNYSIDENGNCVRFENAFGEFSLRCLAGNWAVAESYGVIVFHEHRGIGLGRQQHADRLLIAKEAGLGCLIATVEDENIPQIKILEKNQWKKLYSVYEGCSLWLKEL